MCCFSNILYLVYHPSNLIIHIHAHLLIVILKPIPPTRLIQKVSAASSAIETLNSRLYAPRRVSATSINAPRIPLTAAQKRARNKSSVNPREVNTAARTSLTKKADRRARSQSAINPADVRAAKETRPHPFLSKKKSLGSPKTGSPLGSPALFKKGVPASGTAAARGRQRLSKHEQRAHPLLGRSATTNSSRRRKLPEAPAGGGDGDAVSALTARSATAPDTINVVLPLKRRSSGGTGSAAATSPPPDVSSELWSALNHSGSSSGNAGGGDADADAGVAAVAAAAAAATGSAATGYQRKKKKKKSKPNGAGSAASALEGLRLDDFDDDAGSTQDEADPQNYDDDDGSDGGDDDDKEEDTVNDGTTIAVGFHSEEPLSPLSVHSPEGEWEGAFDEDEIEAAREAAAAEAATATMAAASVHVSGGSKGTAKVLPLDLEGSVVAAVAAANVSARSPTGLASSVPHSPQLLGDDDIAAIMAPPAPTALPAPPTPQMPPATDSFMDMHASAAAAAPPPGFEAAEEGGSEAESDGDLLSLVRAPVVLALTPEQAARQAKLARARAMQAERHASGADDKEQMKKLLADSRAASETAASLLARGASSGVASRK